MKKKLNKWCKVPLFKALKTTKEEIKMMINSRTLKFFPTFLLYSISIILLLKFAQIILF